MWNGPTYNPYPQGYAGPSNHGGSQHIAGPYPHPRGPHGGPPPPPSQNAGSNNDLTWEEIYDSGQLDVQLKNQLSLTGLRSPPTQTGGPPPNFYLVNGSQPPQAPSQPQPLMSIVTRPPSAIPPPQQQQPRGPPMIARRPPSAPLVAPDLLFSQPPPPIRVASASKRPQIMKRTPQMPPNAPYRPTGGSISMGRIITKIQPVVSQEVFEPSQQPAVEVEIDEEHPRTQYRPPEPKVKILKRPSSTPNNLSGEPDQPSDEASPSAPEDGKSKSHKSLKQREQEYAQARLRILGSAEPVQDVIAPESVNKSEEVSKNPYIVRSPKGPDGSRGFDLKR